MVDVTAFEMPYTHAFRPGISHSPATHFRTFIFATQHPQPIAAYLTMLEPFSVQVWLATLLTLLVISTAFVLVEKNYTGQFDWFDIFSVSIGIMLSESIATRYAF